MIFGEKKEGLPYHNRVGIYAIILDHQTQRILLIHHQSGQYFLPGGGLDEGETFEGCLKRELLEETGFSINIGTYIGEAKKYHLAHGVTPTLSHAHFFAASLLEKIQDPTEVEEEAIWVPIEDYREYLFHEHQAWAVEQQLRKGGQLEMH